MSMVHTQGDTNTRSFHSVNSECDVLLLLPVSMELASIFDTRETQVLRSRDLLGILPVDFATKQQQFSALASWPNHQNWNARLTMVFS